MRRALLGVEVKLVPIGLCQRSVGCYSGLDQFAVGSQVLQQRLYELLLALQIVEDVLKCKLFLLLALVRGSFYGLFSVSCIGSRYRSCLLRVRTTHIVYRFVGRWICGRVRVTRCGNRGSGHGNALLLVFNHFLEDADDRQ